MKPEILEIQPLQLKFTFELKKQSTCDVQMTNKTNHYVAFKIKTTNPKKYCVRPNAGVIDPNGLCDFSVTMQAPKAAPPDMISRDKFLVQSTIVPEGTMEEDVTSSMFAKGDGKIVDEKKLKVLLIPSSDSSESSPVNEHVKVVATNEVKELKDNERVEVVSTGEIKELKDNEPVKVVSSNESKELKDNEPVKVVASNERKEVTDDIIQKNSSRAMVDESMEVLEGDGQRAEWKKKDESPQRKVEAVKRIEEPVKPSQEYADRKEESMQINDKKELTLAKDVEEMKSKLKELESKLTEAKASILQLSEEKRTVAQEKHCLQGELDLVRSKRHRAQAGFPLLFVFMVGLVSLYLGHLLHS